MKNTNRLRRVLIFLSLFVPVFLCVRMVFSYAYSRIILDSRIDTLLAEYKSGRVQYVDVASINGIKWDRVYLFGGYSYCDNVASVVNVPSYKTRCDLTPIAHSEDATLFVFKYKNRVVRDVKYFGRSYRHKCDPNTYLPYSPKDAKFVFDKNGDFICVAKEVK